MNNHISQEFSFEILGIDNRWFKSKQEFIEFSVGSSWNQN